MQMQLYKSVQWREPLPPEYGGDVTAIFPESFHEVYGHLDAATRAGNGRDDEMLMESVATLTGITECQIMDDGLFKGPYFIYMYTCIIGDATRDRCIQGFLAG